MQIYSSYCAYLCANYFSVNNLPLICHACVGIRNCCQLSDMSEEGAGSILISISPQRFSRKRLRERFITFASSVANVILGSCKRYPWRTHVFALSDASTCRSGCRYLQGRMHVLAGKVACISVEDAVHCRSGCSALRGRLQCTASEMGKKGHRNRQSNSDKRKGREEDSIGALHPPGYFC